MAKERWVQGEAYRWGDGPGDWIVQQVLEGPVIILGIGGAPAFCRDGAVVLANYDLGSRLIAMTDEQRLHKLTRV